MSTFISLSNNITINLEHVISIEPISHELVYNHQYDMIQHIATFKIQLPQNIITVNGPRDILYRYADTMYNTHKSNIMNECFSTETMTWAQSVVAEEHYITTEYTNLLKLMNPISLTTKPIQPQFQQHNPYESQYQFRPIGPDTLTLANIQHMELAGIETQTSIIDKYKQKTSTAKYSSTWNMK